MYTLRCFAWGPAGLFLKSEILNISVTLVHIQNWSPGASWPLRAKANVLSFPVKNRPALTSLWHFSKVYILETLPTNFQPLLKIPRKPSTLQLIFRSACTSSMNSTGCAAELLYKRATITGASFHFDMVWMWSACQHIAAPAISTSVRPITEIDTF